MRRYEVPGTPIRCIIVDPLEPEERKKRNREIYRNIQKGLQILAEDEALKKAKGK